MSLMEVALVGIGGSVGATARVGVGSFLRAQTWHKLPIATVIINVSGSLLLGVLTGLVLFRGVPAALTTYAGAGFCGGYTTFSTTCLETVQIIRQGAVATASAYAMATLLGSVGAGAVGLALSRV
jgi:fluoride exporter